MNWHLIENNEQLNELIKTSYQQVQLIFKHSTRCSISVMAKARLDKVDNIPNVTCHYLDLLNYRDISNLIASTFNVHHESPQVLLIKSGECIYDETHSAITVDGINEQIAG